MKHKLITLFCCIAFGTINMVCGQVIEIGQTDNQINLAQNLKSSIRLGQTFSTPNKITTIDSISIFIANRYANGGEIAIDLYAFSNTKLTYLATTNFDVYQQNKLITRYFSDSMELRPKQSYAFLLRSTSNNFFGVRATDNGSYSDGNAFECITKKNDSLEVNYQALKNKDLWFKVFLTQVNDLRRKVTCNGVVYQIDDQNILHQLKDDNKKAISKNCVALRCEDGQLISESIHGFDWQFNPKDYSWNKLGTTISTE